MATITIIIGSGPYTTERPYTAMRFAYTALINDHKVNMFLFEDAIFAVKNNQNPSNVYNLEEWVKKCMDEDNFTIAACGVCMKTRGMSESELLDGVKLGTMEMALEMTLESDKQLFF